EPDGVMPAENCVIAPDGVIRPMRSPLSSVNHRLPSGPAVIPSGPSSAGDPTNSVTTPAGVMRPMELRPNSVNHRLPSGPAAMENGAAFEVMPVVNSVTVPDGVMRPI